jgi:peroxiredoxin
LNADGENMTANLYELPQDLPAPVDDGAADHLRGMPVPSIGLTSTAGRTVNLAEVSRRRRTVVYCYPLTGAPGQNLPAGWDEIPGARGCTPQSCAFRDHFTELQALDTLLFGLSTQTTEYQREMAQRLRLPFEVLSDAELAFTKSLGLPTFEAESKTLIRRLTLVLSGAKIVKVFYPVFPPDRNAEEVIAWLSEGRHDES